MKVGGVQGRTSKGIHWHVDPNIQVRYLADATRETIYDVELIRADGSQELFRSRTKAPEDAVWRTMDCVDCHNRPTHVYREPGEEVDQAIFEGRIDRALPFIKHEAVEALQVRYGSHEEARAGLSEAVDSYYREHYPEVAQARADTIRAVGRELGEIYAHNIFPAMEVYWGTYPNHLGHANSPGCLRCHDNGHRNADGKRISKDCEICHSVLADAEESPEIIEQLQP